MTTFNSYEEEHFACPFRFGADHGVRHCISRECAAWRWSDTDHDLGFCGLAGPIQEVRPAGVSAHELSDARLYVNADGVGEGADAVDIGEVRTAARFLSLLGPTESASVCSYRLKHVAEEWGKRNGGARYITNGALILAAASLGINIARVPGSINADVFVSPHAVDDIERSWRGEQ